MRVSTNILGLAALSNLRQVTSQMQLCLTRLSTGLRINTGADDPAGLIAAMHLDTEIVNLQAEMSGAARTGCMLATADAGAGEIGQSLAELRGLLTASANSGAMTDDEIAANQVQIDALVAGIEQTADSTTFAGQKLLEGKLGFDLAPDALGDADTGHLDSLVTSGANDLSSGNIETAAAIVDLAITQVAQARGTLGAEQRDNYESAVETMQTTLANLSDSRAMIMDTDYASELANMNRLAVLGHVALALTALAGAAPRQALSLLYG